MRVRSRPLCREKMSLVFKSIQRSGAICFRTVCDSVPITLRMLMVLFIRNHGLVHRLLPAVSMRTEFTGQLSKGVTTTEKFREIWHNTDCIDPLYEITKVLHMTGRGCKDGE